MSQPLWRVMEAAFLDGRSPGFNDCYGYAAELRAVADWLSIYLAAQIRPDDLKKVTEALIWAASKAETGE